MKTDPGGAAERGAPPLRRSGVTAVAVVALTLAVGIVAYLIGRGVATPAQEAARTRAPAPSVLTAPVQLTHARTTVVLRGTLTDGGAIAVQVPGDLDGNVPVVTAVAAARGTEVGNGSVIASVADRPVFVMQGSIPAYGPMSFGTSGTDVAELQAALTAFGLTTEPDRSGSFGAGTAAAVSAFYTRAGFAAVTTSAVVTTGSGTHRQSVVKQFASVPLGEISFVPRLPVEVVSARTAGQTLGSGDWLAKLGSGRLAFAVKTDVNTAGVLAVGATGTAVSDLTGGSFPITLAAKHGTAGGGGPATKLIFTPVSASAATPYVGQNMALRISTGAAGGLQWVVPEAAVVTSASGGSTVTVLRGSRQVSVPVRPGLAFAGSQIVRPIHGGLAAGDQVVVGVGG